MLHVLLVPPLLATGTNECFKQFQVFGVPHKQPFRVELDGQQVRQHASRCRGQFQALDNSIPAYGGSVQRLGQPGHSLMV
jgi:hypothetical protein